MIAGGGYSLLVAECGYSVQECDATMLVEGKMVGTKKSVNEQTDMIVTTFSPSGTCLMVDPEYP